MRNYTKLLIAIRHASVHKNGKKLKTMMALTTFLALVCFGALLTIEVLTYNSKGSQEISTRGVSREAMEAALLHYATHNASGETVRMERTETMEVAKAILEKTPCNVLVFGVGHESLLWQTLNMGGRTVFVDESETRINKLEEMAEGVEAYEVQFTTKVKEHEALLGHAREHRRKECRPVQNLLFSECRLAIVDMPNHIYSIGWDVIIIDGPRGYYPDAPGRMSSIFTSAVLARTKSAADSVTHVFVHDFNRSVEKIYSGEFLCQLNMVSVVGHLAHFQITNTRMLSSHEFCESPLPGTPSSVRSTKTKVGKRISKTW